MDDWESRVRANIAVRLRPRGAQSALARKLTIHDQAWLSRYVAGQFTMDIGTLGEICRAWQIDIAELLGDTAQAPTQEQVEAEKVARLWLAVPESDRPLLRRLIRRFVPPGSDAGDESSTADPVDPGEEDRETTPRRQRRAR